MISTDFSTPSFIEREKTITLEMPVYEDGPSPVSPISGTFNLYDQNKTIIVTGPVVITNNIATFTIQSTSLPSTLSLSDLWQEEWVLTMSSGVETIRRDAFLVLRSLYNVVNEAMLRRRVTDLASLKPSNIESFQGYIDEAFSDIQNKLIQAGKRPYLILNSYALKDVLVSTTLQYMFEDFETYMAEGRFSQRAEDYKKAAILAWDSLKLEYDDSENNKRGAATTSEPVVSVIYTNSPPNWAYRSNGSF